MIEMQKRILALMEIHNENAKQMASAAGIAYTTLMGFLKGDRDSIRVETVSKIAKHYNVTLDYLVNGEDGLSGKAVNIGTLYDKLDENSKELIEWVVEHEYKRSLTSFSDVKSGSNSTVVIDKNVPSAIETPAT